MTVLADSTDPARTAASLAGAMAAPQDFVRHAGDRRWIVSAAAWLCYAFLLIPSLIIIPLSFGGARELEFPPKSLSFGLYRAFFDDPAWWQPMLQSLLVGAATTVLSIVLTIPAAYALARSEFPGRRLLHGVFLSPMLVPVIVLGLGLYLQFAGMRLVDTTAGLVLAHTMLVVPFVMLAASSALQHIDVSLEISAQVMGAGRGTVFFAFLISLDEVVIAYFVTGPSTMTLPVKMFSAIRWEVSPVLAAVSTLLTAFALAVALGIVMLQNKEHRHD
jgi:putative spermidine/putrescine transport system permease protein